MNQQNPAQAQQGKFHFLIAASITFAIGTQEEREKSGDAASVLKNTLLRLEKCHVTQADLARAQQNVQAQLAQDLGLTTPFAVYNVVITNVSNLGWMTDEEFNNLPKQES